MTEIGLSESPAPGRPRARVAIIFPAQHLRDAAGAAEVLRQQHEWLAEQGYASHLVLTAPSLSPLRSWRSEQAEQALSQARALGFDKITVVGLGWRRPRRWSAILRLAIAVLRQDWSLDTDLATSDVLDTQAIRLGLRNETDFVICNYLSGISVANDLAPPERQLLILHDWIDTAPSPAIAQILREDRGRIALNAEEAERITLAAPEHPCLVGIPVRLSRDVAAALQPRPLHLADALAASGPEARAAAQPPATASLEGSQAVDLLFVGGAHGPNREGITAFVRDCFGPFLSARGINLVIAGAVGQHLDLAPLPGLHIVGRVRDLRPLYDAARLVIVPLLTGTGISIKTLEAIGMDKPVLATPVGLRGLGDAADLAHPPPFDQSWANQILELLESPEHLERNRAKLKRLARGQSLGEALAKAFASVSR